MDSSTLSALNAYRNQMSMMQNASEGVSAEESSSPSFAQMVRDAFGEAVNAQHTAEDAKMQALTTNRVDMTELVTAVTNAELTLNTVVAVRDRVINAYQDILRMTI